MLTPLATLLAADADNNVLPDGTVFRPWQPSRRHVRTYHVAQNAPLASDENPGTAERPWRTIGQTTDTGGNS